MKGLLFGFLVITGLYGQVWAQVKTPDEFLGYELGSRFTPHEKVLDYFRYVAGRDKQTRLIGYGKSYEGRDLLVAVLSSKSNMENLELIRKNSLGLSRARKPEGPLAAQPAVLWLSYNVHGNEASSGETAMKTLYALSGGKTARQEEWLKNVVVVIDPCLNPDGRERYVNYFASVSGKKPNPNPMSREHFEPWPGGRTNHYYFDLNRDWAWQSQIETQQRLKLYRQWMPQVHVDFHEQNYNEPYYFAPAAEPIHVDITPWQRAFQVTVGKNNAKYFDERGWAYFTKERFDLLYPSYGDTYPLYNGAVGMTYEQGGIGAGLVVVTLNGDTLTLKDRIDHHFASGMATLETVSRNAGRLIEEFKLYFERGLTTPPGTFKTYVLKAQNLPRIKRLAALLERNGIEYAFGLDRNMRGLNYENKKVEGFKVERNDLVVNLQQPPAVLANVLLEPQTEVSDSNTYDITAWSLPYVYGLKGYACKESVKGLHAGPLEKIELSAVEKPYAWIFEWNSQESAQALLALQKLGLKVRMAEESFTVASHVYAPGTLLVYRVENERSVRGMDAKIERVAGELNIAYYTMSGGTVDKGRDLGSSVYPLLAVPKIGLISGWNTSAESLGEIWHFFEQELGHSITLLNTSGLDNLDFNKINVLIVPDGSYSDNLPEKLESWVRKGGKLILLEDAVAAFAGKKPYGIKMKTEAKDDINSLLLSKYGKRNQGDLSNVIPGAIFKVVLDQSHPLAAGLGNYYYALKTDDKIFDPLEKGWNIGMLKTDSYVAGVAGSKVVKRLNNGMLFGVQQLDRGTVIYLGSDILFRSFWENGKQMFMNAVFLVD